MLDILAYFWYLLIVKKLHIEISIVHWNPVNMNSNITFDLKSIGGIKSFQTPQNTIVLYWVQRASWTFKD